MEQNLEEKIISPSSNSIPVICPVCHQPVLSQYYFCPNCGAKVKEAPLSTTIKTQAWVYALSIILPMICFIFVTRWPGVKYLKSNNPKAKQIGIIAWVLIVLSTIFVIWFVYTWTQKTIQSSIDSINADFGSF